MKKIMAFFEIVLVVLIATMLVGCRGKHSTKDSPTVLQNKMSPYTEMLLAPLPKDLTLTIYYIDFRTLTYKPINAEELTEFHNVQKIIVEYDDLIHHTDLLKRMDPSILQPVTEQSYMNARLYYVVESKEYGELLEVIISQVYGNVFVNGVEVADNSVFYEYIEPYLSEEAYSALGIWRNDAP